ncbi:hypothetical protein [Nocardia heshunensis]
MSGNIDQYRTALEAELAPKLAERGLLVAPDWSDDEVLMFAGQLEAAPGVAASVYVIVEYIKGAHRLYGSASLISIDAGKLISGLPRAARMAEWGETDWDLGLMDLTIFSDHIDPGEYDLYAMYDLADVVDAATWFMRCVDGPVGDWFSQRDSLTKLVAQARKPQENAVNDQSPRAQLVRATVIVSALNGRLADAAGLMGWYLRTGLFSEVDSYEQATAFDAALRERFPGYAQARTLMS